MFLAWNEIRHDKLRYALIVGVMFLIAYLVFFLTGLAYGLAQDNRTAVDKWDADGVILTSEANNSLNMSMLPLSDQEKIQAKETAVLGQTPGVIQSADASDKIDVSFFGIRKNEFLMPSITEGRAFSGNREVVADSSLKERYDLAVGDRLTLAGNDLRFTISGFTENAKFNVAPVLYLSIDAYQEIRFEQVDPTDNARVNTIVFRGAPDEVSVDGENNELDVVPINTFIMNLPGYQAQLLTFGFMIGFLILIAAIVIGIFIYVLTIQKTTIFGVMKAQGISGRYISLSVIFQTFLLAVFGVTLGAVGTIGTGFVLPAAVPFQSNWLFFAVIGGLMLLMAILGAFFSVRSITKIDPLKAIG